MRVVAAPGAAGAVCCSAASPRPPPRPPRPCAWAANAASASAKPKLNMRRRFIFDVPLIQEIRDTLHRSDGIAISHLVKRIITRDGSQEPRGPAAGQMIGFCRLLERAFGPRSFMKNPGWQAEPPAPPGRSWWGRRFRLPFSTLSPGPRLTNAVAPWLWPSRRPAGEGHRGPPLLHVEQNEAPRIPRHLHAPLRRLFGQHICDGRIPTGAGGREYPAEAGAA